MLEGANDRKNKRIAFLVSAGIHTCLFLTFFFLVSWRAPYPPAPEYGVVLNYGVDDQGGGEIQPETPVGNAATDDKSGDLKSDEQKNITEPEKTETQEAEAKVEEKPGIVSDETSNTVVREDAKKTEVKPKVKKTEKIADNKPVEKKVEEKKPVINKDALYTGDKGTKKGESNQSQGDDPGKIGDKGNPQGKLDAKALYGKPGGGGGGDGFGLSMSGWEWATKPKIPDLPDNQDGRIEFEIECDEDGDIIGITTKENGLSPKAEQLLKEEIRKNSLIRTSSGKVAEKSKGRVVFVLKTK
ncbi:MAG: cell envelope integrity protein TolA [Bacteroidetes bacterium]|nr:cell envelope integrity protein TolA [Bacteroidota bacterium]MBS1539239.1 cell envelope integrity protein TolA [Bacteroidota bacterium]